MDTKHLYHAMSNEIALDLVREWCKPNTPTLGMWLGWNQPNPGNSVKLGSIYGTVPDKYTFREILQSCQGIDFGNLRYIVKQIKDAGLQLDREYKFTGIYSDEEVFLPFDRLTRAEKCLYRLHVMVMNTMTDLHNWAIEYGSYLASYYADSAEVSFRLYDDDTLADNMLGLVLEYCTNEPVFIQVEESENPIYHYEKKVNQDVLQWLNDLDENQDVCEYVFGQSVRDYDKEDVFTILSLAIEWVISEWKSGNLELHSSDEIDSKALQYWLCNIENQEVLPGF